jgi:hypothetical protein
MIKYFEKLRMAFPVLPLLASALFSRELFSFQNKVFESSVVNSFGSFEQIAITWSAAIFFLVYSRKRKISDLHIYVALFFAILGFLIVLQFNTNFSPGRDDRSEYANNTLGLASSLLFGYSCAILRYWKGE